MTKTLRTITVIVTATVTILAGLAVWAAPAGAAERSTSPVISLSSFTPTGSSTLVNTGDGVSAQVTAADLTPGHVVTLWWVVFNAPDECAHGIPNVSSCGHEDLFNPATGGSVLHAAGRVIGRSGEARYGARLNAGDTSAAMMGNGLTAPADAEIILVLRSHGPKIPHLTSEMLSTFGAGCKDAPPGTGTPADNDCTEVAVSVHAP